MHDPNCSTELNDTSCHSSGAIGTDWNTPDFVTHDYSANIDLIARDNLFCTDWNALIIQFGVINWNVLVSLFSTYLPECSEHRRLSVG